METNVAEQIQLIQSLQSQLNEVRKMAIDLLEDAVTLDKEVEVLESLKMPETLILIRRQSSIRLKYYSKLILHLTK
jgi:hypothetical protein